MPTSKVEEAIELTNDKYCVSLLYRSRINQRRGLWGVLLIEGIDELNEPFLFQIAHPFKRGSFEISHLTQVQFSQPLFPC